MWLCIRQYYSLSVGRGVFSLRFQSEYAFVREFCLLCWICESSVTFGGSGVFSSAGDDGVQGHGG